MQCWNGQGLFLQLTCDQGEFFVKQLLQSCVFLKAEEGLMAVIFDKTFGSPQYRESSMLSLIWLIKIMLGINDKFEKSWSATFSNRYSMPIVGANKTDQITNTYSIFPGMFIDCPSIVNIIICFPCHMLLNHVFNRKSTCVFQCWMCCSIFWPKLRFKPGKWKHLFSC